MKTPFVKELSLELHPGKRKNLIQAPLALKRPLDIRGACGPRFLLKNSAG